MPDPAGLELIAHELRERHAESIFAREDDFEQPDGIEAEPALTERQTVRQVLVSPAQRKVRSKEVANVRADVEPRRHAHA